jgi:hypothetical protein
MDKSKDSPQPPPEKHVPESDGRSEALTNEELEHVAGGRKRPGRA